jgi:hypothetical protein
MITEQEFYNEYTKLIIPQWYNEENVKFMESILLPSFEVKYSLDYLLEALSLDTSTGYWLDLLGRMLNVTRAYNGSSLDDEDFRQLIKFKIIYNNVNCSFTGLSEMLYNFFNNDVLFTDSIGSLTYIINSDSQTYSEPLINAVIEKKLLPRPIGSDAMLVIKLSTQKIVILPRYNEELPFFAGSIEDPDAYFVDTLEHYYL